MSKQFSNIFLGVLFVLFGTLLLLNELDILYFSWSEAYPVILIVLSISSFISVFRGNKDASFWGTVLGVSGIFFFFRNYGFVDYFWVCEVWPVILLSLGLGFIALFILKPHDWGVLIPGSILTFLGITFILETLNIK